MLAGAIMAGVAMYFINQANSAGLFGGARSSTASISDQPKAPTASEDDDSDSEEDEEEEQDLKSFEDEDEECKLVLVVRTDLGMTKGTFHPQRSPNPTLAQLHSTTTTITINNTTTNTPPYPHQAKSPHKPPTQP